MRDDIVHVNDIIIALLFSASSFLLCVFDYKSGVICEVRLQTIFDTERTTLTLCSSRKFFLKSKQHIRSAIIYLWTKWHHKISVTLIFSWSLKRRNTHTYCPTIFLFWWLPKLQKSTFLFALLFSGELSDFFDAGSLNSWSFLSKFITFWIICYG